MEQKSENKKIEELTDEQLKEVSGGNSADCVSTPHCAKYDADCNCTKCEAGYVLDSGKCKDHLGMLRFFD